MTGSSDVLSPFYEEASMGTCHFEKTDLQALQGTLDDILTTLRAQDPHRNWDADPQLKTCIAEKIMALAAVGITAPDELRRRVLETPPLA